ncbi:MAG: nitrogenase component 1 [Sporomusaceae bacterium]|nr:nitrogenase component 1 [Sporomusaceae bacterium]
MVLNKRYKLTMKRSCSCSMPGVWRAASHNQGAIVLYHSPKACSHVTREMDLSSYYYAMARRESLGDLYTAPLISSDLKAEHAIFGGADQLRDCLLSVAAEYKPAYILIANSCVAGVIGDDVVAVAKEAEAKLGVPILTVPCSGFMDGEYYGGYYYAAKAMADRFMEPLPKEAYRVTLLGLHSGLHSLEIQEMSSLLTGFSFSIAAVFPGYSSLADIERVAASSLLIPMGGRSKAHEWMCRLASDLQERFAIPFPEREFPIGWSGTKRWLQEIGHVLGMEQKAAAIVKLQEERLQQTITRYQGSMRQVGRLVLAIGRPLPFFDPDWVLEWLQLLDIKVEFVILFDELTAAQQDEMRQRVAGGGTVPIVDEAAGVLLLKESDILITTNELENPEVRQFLLPMLPPIGVGGLLAVTELFIRLIRRMRRQGVVQYGW